MAKPRKTEEQRQHRPVRPENETRDYRGKSPRLFPAPPNSNNKLPSPVGARRRLERVLPNAHHTGIHHDGRQLSLGNTYVSLGGDIHLRFASPGSLDAGPGRPSTETARTLNSTESLYRNQPCVEAISQSIRPLGKGSPVDYLWTQCFAYLSNHVLPLVLLETRIHVPRPTTSERKGHQVCLPRTHFQPNEKKERIFGRGEARDTFGRPRYIPRRSESCRGRKK